MGNNLIEILSKKSPWLDNNNSIWLTSTLTLCRNVEKFKFPGKLEIERRKQLIALVSKDVLGVEELKSSHFIKGEDVSPQEKEFLAEHYFSSESLQYALQGEAFIIDDTGQFFSTLNIKDHVRLHLMDCRGELDGAWNQIVKIETSLGKSIAYSYSPRFGFLTADPMECGTAFILQVFLQVPVLIHTNRLNEYLSKNPEEAIHFSGMFGEINEYIGDILMMRNNYTLGVNEEGIISTLRVFANKLIAEEHEARKLIKEQDSPELKDKVSRAFAVLIHSYQIETIEALNAISLMKLGVEFGWVEGISISKLNNLFFNCRRAHLLSHFPEKVSQEEIPHRRAEFIHKYLKEVKLTI